MKDKSFSVTDADTISEYKGKVAQLEKRHSEIMADLQGRAIHLLSKHCWCSPTGHCWTQKGEVK